MLRDGRRKNNGKGNWSEGTGGAKTVISDNLTHSGLREALLQKEVN